jgi:hypothetical protein
MSTSWPNSSPASGDIDFFCAAFILTVDKAGDYENHPTG